ncbi:MAG TPA: response regulator [Anaeromyxobacteraceae bacterium]|nr:response regulator [Anaeromyxobacteraceae bacterium]
MKTELSIVMERAHGERLAHAERVIRWLLEIHAAALLGFDVAYDGPRRTLHAFVRLEAARFHATDLHRVRFWVARAGGRVRDVTEMEPPELEALQRATAHFDVRAIGVEPGSATRALRAIATAAGLDAGRRCYADDRPTLTLDVGGPGWEAVRWNDAEEALFVASPVSPPLGDPIPVSFRTRGVGRVAVEWARVVGVRGVDEAGPGRPAGFSLGLSTSPAELRREIARSAPTAEFGTRAAPRYSFSRPLDAYFRPAPRVGGDLEEGGPVVAGWVENLSLGGAFVRTGAPLGEGAQLQISFNLPNGSRLTTSAAVVFVDVRGMGVRFVLDPRSMAAIHDALTEVSARHRRALVIDDDGVARQLYADALVERGFEVISASDAEEGLRILAEELLMLDLLLTDELLPGTLGEELVARIRQLGGESDLVIAVITGSPDAELAARLRVAGADLLLGKGLGPEIVAMKVDALLEERLTGQRVRTTRTLAQGLRPHPTVAA